MYPGVRLWLETEENCWAIGTKIHIAPLNNEQKELLLYSPVKFVYNVLFNVLAFERNIIQDIQEL